ncbi:DNA-binding protein [Enterococcus faecalis]|uniref:DNA-binding protein n=1 Tax=Enterococcus faecalis TaxID=1351 RepID=A0ABD7IYZ9_ENTFL|nr:helix-turn-helix domain-containing protein [Enterococcus faecalis]EGO2744185.1 helix-turn-helix domain-containing protein [Enterococcus faecalis]EGO2804252.1 helix-turn-helix domain-containing protein [Enterococcus faecalis]EGO2812895.1 helix-turn-helix domain-containing protein [Enterococcus faecalis]EGO2831936.1 helix-turn-helix domain-containing protein [Enterococcus faecalis]EGO5088592.1 helix-turn-helix domain-containing protein [Enterococcus faecalis]
MSKNNNKRNTLELENYLFHSENIDHSIDKLKGINQLPLVLTNKDLKEQLQISDSTLNRLIKLEDFPSCWFGIRGHYLRDDILEWVKKGKEEYFCDQFRLLRLS